MRKQQFKVIMPFLVLGLILSACAKNQQITTTPQPEIEFQADGSASLFVPSLNGNLLSVRMTKPPGDGPFPVLIGVPGTGGIYAFDSEFTHDLIALGIVAVDFAVQGRGESEGQDDHYGRVHQNDLKAVVDFISQLSFVQRENIGLLSYSYGIVLATGALYRYPKMPIAFLIDWEGPSCPAKDILRAIEDHETWVTHTLTLLGGSGDMSAEEASKLIISGGMISDEAYWSERDASRFAEGIPCPYLRIQFDVDHVQGTSKNHMLAIINAATEKSGQWTRANDNPPNIIYSEDELERYHFHTYPEGIFPGSSSAMAYANEVILMYVEEMFFEKPDAE